MVWQVAGIEVTQKRQVRSNAAGGGRFLLPRRFRNERGEKTSDTIWVSLGAHPLILPFMDSTYDISNLYIYIYVLENTERSLMHLSTQPQHVLWSLGSHHAQKNQNFRSPRTPAPALDRTLRLEPGKTSTTLATNKWWTNTTYET